MFESRENTTVSAAFLCKAVCISDVINKADMCGKSIAYVTSQPFSAHDWSKSEPTWLLPEELKFEAKNTFLYKYQ